MLWFLCLCLASTWLPFPFHEMKKRSFEFRWKNRNRKKRTQKTTKTNDKLHLCRSVAQVYVFLCWSFWAMCNWEFEGKDQAKSGLVGCFNFLSTNSFVRCMFFFGQKLIYFVKIKLLDECMVYVKIICLLYEMEKKNSDISSINYYLLD